MMQTQAIKMKPGPKKGSKQTKEHIAKRVEASKGKVGLYWKGKKLSEEHRKKLRKHLIGNKHTLGKFPSEGTRRKMSLKKRRENNPNWGGGIYPQIENIRRCKKYKEWQIAVFERDNYTCIDCGDKRGGNLNADHIISFIEIIQKYNITTLQEALECQELWKVENGRTLCYDCHKKTKTFGRRKKSVS